MQVNFCVKGTDVFEIGINLLFLIMKTWLE